MKHYFLSILSSDRSPRPGPGGTPCPVSYQLPRVGQEPRALGLVSLGIPSPKMPLCKAPLCLVITPSPSLTDGFEVKDWWVASLEPSSFQQMKREGRKERERERELTSSSSFFLSAIICS